MKHHTTMVTAAAVTTIILSSCVAGAGKKGQKPPNPNIEALTVVSTISAVDGAIDGFICADGTITSDPQDACGVTSIRYPISGAVFAATVNSFNGETIGTIAEIGTVNATPVFDVSFFALNSADWATLPAMQWTIDSFSMKVNGSTFEKIEGMALTGRAFPALGPAEDPVASGAASLRMAGCEGVREVSGVGAYANKVGTMCLNGTFSFQPNFDGKGVSNCTLVLHDPLQ